MESSVQKNLCAGLLAHVDSGKTTLTEAMLYRSGALRRAGRVDHGDAFLDHYALERSRGITIFAKEARLTLPHTALTLLDTPGHVDFSAEMERTLAVLDYAVLIISGTAGVQSHTETLWRLLERYRIPTFLFINKMDQPGADRAALLDELQKKLHPGCMPPDADPEALALCSEGLMADYLARGALSDRAMAEAIAGRELFPCYFGSALRLEGIDPLLAGLDTLTVPPTYPDEFSARVYKISADEQGNRLTHLKVTGGSLKVRTALPGESGADGRGEKINQIRLYSGAKYQTAEEIPAGTVAAVTGLSRSYAGQGLGAAADAAPPLLEPVMSYCITLPEGCDPHTALARLRLLEQEDPQLHLLWDERRREIRVRLMGEIQQEILQSVAKERCGLEIGFSQGSILYRETIAAPVEGIGHYEPLRHYAEVHLLLEPLPRGAGVQLAADCRADQLEPNWQRLILSHLAEKTHLGVLTGSPITDIKITLIAGRAHPKHTEGGDFRQATYRAVRQGLRSAQSILLEPVCRFRLELPPEQLGRALNDLQRMEADFAPPETAAGTAVLTGTAALAALQEYPAEVIRYTHGRGRLLCEPAGYAPCRHAQEVIEAAGYDCDADTENPADSIFCSHGAGHPVRWDEVPQAAHLQTHILQEQDDPEPAVTARRSEAYRGSLLQDRELIRIFEMTYGPIKRRGPAALHTEKTAVAQKAAPAAPLPEGPEYLLVDGYNIIFAWEELKELAREDLDSARARLIQLLCNYQGYRRCELILVFDAYKVKGNPGTVERHHGISVVYTKEAETADMYIEKVTHHLAKEHRVRVATSDGLEQIIILGHGAVRVSARQFQEEVRQVEAAIREILESM